MHQTYRFNFLITFLFLGFLVLESPLYSQDPEEGMSPGAMPSEDHQVEDLERVIKNYNSDVEKVLDDTSTLENIHHGQTDSEVKDSELESVDVETSPISAIDEKAAAELAESLGTGKKGSKAKDIPKDLSGSVKMALEPLQQLSEEELLKRLDEVTKESPARPYMDRFPKINLFAVRLIKDKESIPSLAKILEDKKRLINFGSVMILSLIVGFVLKKLMKNDQRGFLLSAVYFMARVQFMLLLRLFIIYFFFSKEFAPAAIIFKKTFL